MTGDDTIVLFGRVLADLANANVAELDFPNEIVAVTTGKNGNSIYAANATGRQADFIVRVIRGSPDDRFLNELLQQQLADLPSFPLAEGQMVKRTGDGAGNVSFDTYLVSGGVFTKNVPAKSNVEGDTQQSVAEYAMKFTNSNRPIY